MVKRVFDRRGRNNWDEKTRTKEDTRLIERRRDDRRANNERRVIERRGEDTWADDPAKQNRRKAERRTDARRSGQDRRAEQAAKPKTYVHELVNTSGTGVVALAPEATLSDAVALLAGRKMGLIVIATPDKGLSGVLSERDVIHALDEEGAAALAKEISFYMTRGVWTCSPDDRLADVASAMNANKMRYMPVVKDNVVVGVISATDLMSCFSAASVA